MTSALQWGKGAQYGFVVAVLFLWSYSLVFIIFLHLPCYWTVSYFQRTIWTVTEIPLWVKIAKLCPSASLQVTLVQRPIIMSVSCTPSSSLTPPALGKASYFCNTWKRAVIKFLCREEVAYGSCFLVCPPMIPHLTCQKFTIFFSFPPLNMIFTFWRILFFPFCLYCQ